MHNNINIGNIVQNAIVFNVKNWEEEMMNTDSLRQSVKELFSFLSLREIDYVLVGGIALLHYVDGRNTEDIDIIMALSSLDKLPEIEIHKQDMYFVRGEYKSLQIDILLTENPVFKKVRKEYLVKERFLNHEIPFATVEGLLLLKLYALPSLYRQGNFSRVGIYENDIAMLLHDYRPDIAKLLKELSPHISDSDFAEIENIISDIQGRIERFQKGRE